MTDKEREAKEREDKEREEKKEYLNSVYYIKIAIARLGAEKEELMLSKLIQAMPMNDMPHGGTNLSDLSEYAAELDELERSIMEERYRAIQTYNTIREQIEQMENELERSILIYRHLLCWKWEKIQKKIGYERVQTRKIYNKALSHFEFK